MKLTLLLIPLILLSSCMIDETNNLKTACKNEGGTYDSKHRECTNIGENSCRKIGGTYYSCASPCRHDPDAEVCIAACDTYCKL